LSASESPEVALARLEFEYLCCLDTWDDAGAHRYLLSKLRIAARLKYEHRYISDLVRLANSDRMFRGRVHWFIPFWWRAVRLVRMATGVSAMTMVRFANGARLRDR